MCRRNTILFVRKKIIPDLVVTLDPHKKRIVRWFGDKNLTKRF